jgi:lactoylglutathione lyase
LRVSCGQVDTPTGQARRAGIQPEKPPYSIREGGSRIVFVRDPDQYRVAIIEQPAAAG